MTKAEILAKIQNHRESISTALSSTVTVLEPMVRGWLPAGTELEMINALVELLDFVEAQVDDMKDILQQWPTEEE